MVRNRVKKAIIWSLILASFLPVSSAGALSDWLTRKYSNYRIRFYNSEEGRTREDCVEMGEGGEGSTGGNKWDGHCTNVDSYGSKIEQYYDAIHSVAQNNGLPWEGIVAQLIGESGFMSNEVCPYNPLGLKGSPSCDGKHRTFNNYNEAFNYYVNSIIPVREAKGKFKNDPYAYVDFLINGVPGYKYATDPDYVNKISGYVCGVQRWAKAHGKPISGSMPSIASSTDPGGETSVESLPYCNDEEDDEDYGSENPNVDGYVFPLKGATKANYMHGSSLSPLPCGNLSMGGCHHDYYAMDLGLTIGTKTERDYPDLAGKFSSYFWHSTGVKVVAIAAGRITLYKTYGRATLGYKSKCASVIYETNDGRKFWLGHMLYDSRYKAGDTFNAGQVMGEVGPPPCAVSTQSHLHIDETPKYGDNGSVETVKLINKLYEALP
ncbi:glucosaminidase domain-containing protein [Candidatus Saccharibacteria bacterium]|nr:glucosaminidase domain-containing protein [Candidatus Saccharibacteria bacterium]